MIKVVINKNTGSRPTSMIDDQNLQSVYTDDHSQIFADSSVFFLKSMNGTITVIDGNIKYKRHGYNDVETLDMSSERFKTLVSELPIAECKKQFEGRYLLVRANKNGTIELCHDRYGRKDFYYKNIDEGYIFASDINLIGKDIFHKNYDQFGLIHSLSVYGFRPPKKHTIYSDIKRLDVDQYFIFNNKSIFCQAGPYISCSNENYSKKHLERYSDIFLDTLERQSSPAGNVVYLSSGWDSTSILAGLVHLHGPKKVHAVIGRFKFSKRSGIGNPFELKRAEEVCKYFGVELDYVDINHAEKGQELVDKWQGFQKKHMFAGMSFYLWATLASYVAKEHPGKAVFSGEISDGVHNFGFSQHTTILSHKDLKFREYSDKMASYLFSPDFALRVLEEQHLNDDIFNLVKKQHQNKKFNDLSKNNEELTSELLISMFAKDVRIPSYSLENNNILTEKGRFYYKNILNREYFSEAIKTANKENLISWYTYLYNSFHWQGGTVTTLSYTAEQLGVDINLPFYDGRMQDLLASAPMSWGRGLEILPTKYPLKWMLENKIDYPMHLQVGPHSYLYDINPNFNFTAEFIYHSQYTSIIKDILKTRSYEEILSNEYFNLSYYNLIVENYLSGKEINHERGDLAALCFAALSGIF